MPGLVPGIHVFGTNERKQDVDAATSARSRASSDALYAGMTSLLRRLHQRCDAPRCGAQGTVVGISDRAL